MTVDPTQETVQTFIAEDDGEPLVMLNLLAYDGEAGRAKYMEYAGHTVAHLERVGAEVLYFGNASSPLVPNDGRQWDSVLLVKYPSRAKFLEMVMHPEYQKITHLRTEALADAVLQPTAPLG
ncbi:MAG TPA: DUF1330 domain-containing protein [Solirubrobacterales bacterium]|nr:DUF1330 domain-containing protein [Solirubrobacterales bacterium]